MKSYHYIFEGAKFFSKFNKKSNSKLNFIFADKLINKFNNLCSDFLFGFLLKSYSFQKYKRNQNIYIVKNINVFSSRNIKLKNFHYLNNLSL